ncbi:MAG: HD-GYP domain-containing protein [Candidatus Gastranaerophilaceae bacterium]
MKIVTTEELINYKILPFDIYSEFGERIFESGEVLTPGKLLQLKNLNVIYRDEKETLDILPEFQEEKTYKEKLNNKFKLQQDINNDQVEQLENKVDVINNITQNISLTPTNSTEASTQLTTRQDIPIEEYIRNYKSSVNKYSIIQPQEQNLIKATFFGMREGLSGRTVSSSNKIINNLHKEVLEKIVYGVEDITFPSQLMLLGDYDDCHSLNVAILSGILAKKMGLSETKVADTVKAGLLHDIGKSQIDNTLFKKKAPTNQEQRLIQEHTHIGYKILKYDFKFNERICLVALEHHENNDGSGYPAHKSGDLISKESQIVHICDYYDNLTSHKTTHAIQNGKDALKVLLELGTRYFDAEALYKFIHMFSYNDTVKFEDMIL